MLLYLRVKIREQPKVGGLRVCHQVDLNDPLVEFVSYAFILIDLASNTSETCGLDLSFRRGMIRSGVRKMPSTPLSIH